MMARTRNDTTQYVKLEQRLVLLAWLNGHFGYENNRDLLADMMEAAGGEARRRRERARGGVRGQQPDLRG